MLEGVDKEWIYTDGKNEASYTNLQPGDYVFRVKGSNNDGLWNTEGSSISLEEFYKLKYCSTVVYMVPRA